MNVLHRVYVWTGCNDDGRLGYDDTEWRGDEPGEMGDNLPVIAIPFTANPTTDPTANIPTADPTTELSTHPTLTTSAPTTPPTKNPTTNTVAPTTDPTNYPSTLPTSGPTTDPTNDPSIDPTTDPTIDPVCVQIRVDIIDFNEFDSDQLNDDEELQNEVANVTHYALSRTAFATDYSIDMDSFYVVFDDSDTVYLYDDGQLQKSLFIYETLCALQEDDLVILSEIIQSQCDVVNQLMADKLNALYLKETRTDSLEVSISDMSQLRLLVLLRCHDQVNLSLVLLRFIFGQKHRLFTLYEFARSAAK